MTLKDPRPGSKEAVEAGCNCPVSDNHNGEGIPITNPETGEIQRAYWMMSDCLLHGITEKPLVSPTETP